MRVTFQDLDFKFGVEDGLWLAKRVKEIEKACLNRYPGIQVLFEQKWNFRRLQRRKDTLKLRAASSPHWGHSLLIRFLLGRNKRQVAVATLHEAIAEFRFAQRAEHSA